jgi:hypothetical protein
MPDVITAVTTPLDAIEQAFDRAATYNERSRVAPTTILWPDEKEEWTRLLPRLRERFPQLLTLGEYDPEKKSGPAIWLKCMVARTLDAADWPEEDTPILYLPGVSRQDFRAIEQCPEEIKPLAELQYRGVMWNQTNGRDWTVRAFLMSEHGGLGLDVAGDEETLTLLQRTLPELAETPVDRLRGQRLDADRLRSLVADDPVRGLLTWLSRPEEVKNAWPEDRWATFREICRDTYDFDPEKDGPLRAAKLLGFKEGPWATVWQRFMEAPDRYAGVQGKLRKARPSQTGDLFAREPTWPQDNEALEDELRESFVNLGGMRPDEAAERTRELEEKHSERRQWVWSKLEQAPLAEALKHLRALADAVQSPVGGTTPEAVAESYRGGGWKADKAVLNALNGVREPKDFKAVHAAVNTLYRPWLEDGTEALQAAVASDGVPPPPDPPEPESGEVLLFADALRYDVGKKLVERLQFANLEVEMDTHWSALPPVTPTSKPAVSPIAGDISRESTPDEFQPEIDGKTLTIRRFRNRMEEAGHQIIDSDETGDPTGTAWTEIGTLDKYGHNEEWKLARRIDELLTEIVARIRQLLSAGWSKVRVVTDHGWLLVPGELPKEELSHYLAETRWGRCATLKETSETTHLTVGWHWNPNVRIAMAPDMRVHRKGLGYAHGGISVQECLVPRITVGKTGTGQPDAQISSVEWVRLRCRIQVGNPSEGLQADLRTRPNDPGTSVTTRPKAVKEDGTVSIPVPSPEHKGTEVTAVLLDGDDVIHTYSTTVGSHE